MVRAAIRGTGTAGPLIVATSGCNCQASGRRGGVLFSPTMLEELELSRFESLVGERFELLMEDAEAVTLELTEANSVGELSAKQAAELGKRQPFSLIFRGPAELVLAQATRTLRHPEIGDLTLFLVPIDRNEEGSLFEAVFT